MIGRRYLTAFEKAILDPKLVSMRQELALLDARIAELKDRQQLAESRGQWRTVLDITARLTAALEPGAQRPPDIDRATELATDLYDTARAGVSDYEIWEEIKDLIERRRRIADSERKYEEMEQKLIPITQLVLMFDKLREAIDAVIPDRGMQLQLIQEVRVRCNDEPYDLRARTPLVLPASYLADDSANAVSPGDSGETVDDVEGRADDCESASPGAV